MTQERELPPPERGALSALSGTLIALSGALISTVGAICGIGGGIFGVPLLHYGFRFPLKSAVATSLCLVFATALSATVSESFHPQTALVPPLVLMLVAGSLVGAQIGHRVATRLPTQRLKFVFSVVLLLAGSRLLLTLPPASAAGLAADFAPSSTEYACALAIGLFAGIAVPLLGVGGGLIVVPSLLFVVPQLGYLGARAASLGMATITAARSILLYRNDGLIRWRSAASFAKPGEPSAPTRACHCSSVATATAMSSSFAHA